MRTIILFTLVVFAFALKFNTPQQGHMQIEHLDDKKDIYFITKNDKKAKELNALIGNSFNVLTYDVKKETGKKLVQIQGTPSEIATAKAKQAYALLKDKPVIVDETTLVFDAFKTLPGPYYSAFQSDIGLDGLVKMLKPFNNDKATAQTVLAYMGPDVQDPVLFIGQVTGKIVEQKGDNKFGWDPIFLQDNLTTTYGEMSTEQKNKNGSARAKAAQKLKQYLQSK